MIQEREEENEEVAEKNVMWEPNWLHSSLLFWLFGISPTSSFFCKLFLPFFFVEGFTLFLLANEICFIQNVWSWSLTYRTDFFSESVLYSKFLALLSFKLSLLFLYHPQFNKGKISKCLQNYRVVPARENENARGQESINKFHGVTSDATFS